MEGEQQQNEMLFRERRECLWGDAPFFQVPTILTRSDARKAKTRLNKLSSPDEFHTRDYWQIV